MLSTRSDSDVKVDFEDVDFEKQASWLQIAAAAMRRRAVDGVRPAIDWWRHRDIGQRDVFLASYPKSGNTWLRHLLAHLILGPIEDWHGEVRQISVGVGRHQSLRRTLPGDGRLIKTHRPPRDGYRRSVLVVRHPADVAVSQFFYNRQYSRSALQRHWSWDRFFDAFVSGTVCASGSWHRYHSQWLALATDRRHVVRYEDLHADAVGTLRGVVDYLALEFDDEAIAAAVDRCDADSMRRREQKHRERQGQTDRKFIRGGRVGDGQAVLTEDQMGRLQEVMSQPMKRFGYA